MKNEMMNEIEKYVRDNLDLPEKRLYNTSSLVEAFSGNKKSIFYIDFDINDQKRCFNVSDARLNGLPKNKLYDTSHGTIWISSYKNIFSTIAKAYYGNNQLCEKFTVKEFLDILSEIRSEFKKKQALTFIDNLVKIGTYHTVPNEVYRRCSAVAKQISNIIYWLMGFKDWYDGNQFHKHVNDMFSFTVQHIIDHGGIVLYANLDEFVYVAETPIIFDEDQHNDNPTNFMCVNNGYVTNVKTTKYIPRIDVGDKNNSTMVRVVRQVQEEMKIRRQKYINDLTSGDAPCIFPV